LFENVAERTDDHKEGKGTKKYGEAALVEAREARENQAKIKG
jgi:hypothetical protein